MRELILLVSLLALQLGSKCLQAGAVAAVGGGGAWVQAAPRQRSLLANDSSNIDSSTSDSSGGSSAEGGSPPAARKKRCVPSVNDMARQLPELRQAVLLARSGYNMFSVDGGKNFTALVPNNAALQRLAAGIRGQDERLSVKDGFYSVLLYHQIPQGAYNLSKLVSLGYSGLQTSLGRALDSTDKQYSVSFDGTSQPVVATGGWPANNAKLLRSLEACNGWLHVLDAVLLPTQSLSDLPRLVDDAPDLQNGSFWSLLDGSNLSEPAAPAPSSVPGAVNEDKGGDVEGKAPLVEPSNDGSSSSNGGEVGHHSNSTTIAVSSGNGTMADPAASEAAASSASSSSSGGSSDKVLVIAASVAGGAVATCAAVVAVVLLRKRAAQRQRRLGRLEVLGQRGDDDAELPVKRSASLRPVQLHVDA